MAVGQSILYFLQERQIKFAISLLFHKIYLVDDAYIIWMLALYQSVQISCFCDHYAIYANPTILSK